MRRPRNLSRSSVASSVQCMFSNTTSVGVCSNSSRAAVKILSRPAPEPTASNNPPGHWRAMSYSGASGRGVNRSSHPPQSTRISRCLAQNSRSSAVLPIPASPRELPWLKNGSLTDIQVGTDRPSTAAAPGPAVARGETKIGIASAWQAGSSGGPVRTVQKVLRHGIDTATKSNTRKTGVRLQ